MKKSLKLTVLPICFLMHGCIAPTLWEVTPIGNTDSSTPQYTFHSEIFGDVTYGGSCTSSTSWVNKGDATITLESLANGTYSDCTVSVKDAGIFNLPLATLPISEFTVAAPAVASVNGVYAGESAHFHWAIKNNGDLYGCGSVGWGTLGIGVNPGINTFTLLTTGVELFSSGMGHSIIVKTDGSLWMAGLNGDGQYGNGGTTTNDTFTLIPFAFGDIAKVEGGEHRTFVLTTDGDLYAAGSNSAGQLGIGNQTVQHNFILVATSVKDVKAGRYHTVIQKTDNSLWGAGENGNGQLGLGAPGIQTSWVSLAGGATDIKAFDAGERHIVIIKNDGTVWTAGDDSQGQLGDVNQTGNNINATLKQNATFTDADKVSVGWAFSIIQKGDGTIWRTGQNGNGVLATGNTTPLSVWTELTTPGPVAGMAAGIDSVQYLLDDGSVWAVGRGDDGRLCNGGNNTQNTSLVDTGFTI